MIDLHLMVISYPSRRESLFEAMTLHFAKLVTDDFQVERCQDGEDVLDVAQRLTKRHHRLQTLDLFGHGAGGRFWLGDSMLFASDGTGYGLAKKLGGQLAPDGALRLLGCRTALVSRDFGDNSIRSSGPKLLRDLTRLLGRQRMAWGSTAYLGPRDLGPAGFSARTESRFVKARV